MTTTEITFENFDEIIKAEGIVLVDWFADWCAPCKRFAPIFETASNKHTDIVFGKIDTEAQPQLSANAGITSIPTIMAFRDGVLIHSQAGALSELALEKLIKDVRNPNKAAVKTEAARVNPYAKLN